MADKPEREIDEDLVHQLTRLLDETGLSEIEYGRDGWHIKVAKGGNAGIAVNNPAASPAAEQPSTPEAPVETANAVKSPMVGVVFTSADPESPAFIKVGDSVTEGQTLLLIEAMKVFNPITAPRSGTITQILITNGAPVEFDEPLLILE
jgi:acetyl-CoA carboxylase biotin carboxyl carrier protein